VSGEGPPGPLGRPRLHLRRTDSTNDRARQLAAAGAPHGTLVTAAEQTAGRGRQGRTWSAPAGSSLLMSVLLRWPSTGRSPELLPLAAAVAVCDVAGAGAQIKWPNDIVVRAPGGLAKLAGILIEGRPQERWAVLGIGLNVAVDLEQLPRELRARSATLGSSREQIEPTLQRLLAALERRLAEPPQATLAAWRERDALRGRDIAWSSGQGRADGIDGAGRLVVTLAGGGRRALAAGEVHLLGVG
jgi:BirA family biotin operon repressor/biotin-[acetyl-CoA-carboxylase] ligase